MSGMGGKASTAAPAAKAPPPPMLIPGPVLPAAQPIAAPPPAAQLPAATAPPPPGPPPQSPLPQAAQAPQPAEAAAMAHAAPGPGVAFNPSPVPSEDVQHEFLDKARWIITNEGPLNPELNPAPYTPNAEPYPAIIKAKHYDWNNVSQMLRANPSLINVRPKGRWTALHQAAEAAVSADHGVLYSAHSGCPHLLREITGNAPLNQGMHIFIIALALRSATSMRSGCCCRTARIRRC